MSFLFNKNKERIKAIFDWLAQEADRSDLILVEQKGKESAYYFEFPLKFGDKPRKTETFNKDEVTFLIEFLPAKSDLAKDGCHLIFQSPELEIYESEKRFRDNRSRPWRWGISEQEKRTALEIARKSIEMFFKKDEKPKIEKLDLKIPLMPIFNAKIDLALTLWVKGQMRGYWVAENMILKEGIIEAAISALVDSRFKPLKAEEMPFARIEITLFSDLKIPIGETLLNKNEIIHDKGYSVRKGDKKGVFLPEVSNIKKFKDLNDFLFYLTTEKAFLPGEALSDKKTEIDIFEVQDFIEGDKTGKNALDLEGPTVKTRVFLEVKETADLAAAWLTKIQEPDGNFPPIFNPLNGSVTQIDWSRSALCGWSLVEYGKAAGNGAFSEAGKKSFLYLKNHLLKEMKLIDADTLFLALTFLGRLALSLNYLDEALQCGRSILKKEKNFQFGLVMRHYSGAFLAELSKFDKNFKNVAVNFLQTLADNFESNLGRKIPMNSALWSGAADAYLKLFEITGDPSFLEKAEAAADWLLGRQLNSGAFRSADNSNFVFTRGTAKVIEILSEILLLKKIDPSIHLGYYRQCKECIKKAFDWLATMQYSSENSYFIPEKNLDYIVGGFRHDYFNPDLWIDSAGHFLLAASRFLKAEK